MTVKRSARAGATRSHIARVRGLPCNNSSGGPKPPRRSRIVPLGTGTWQLGNTTSQGNAHAWMGGYVPYDAGKNPRGLAAAVWVGNKGDEVAIKDKGGANIIGGKLPGPIWRDFLDGALTKINAPKATFLPPKNVGSKDIGTGVSPSPSAPVDPLVPSPGTGQPLPSTQPSLPGPPSPSTSKKN